ncbi:hypothetical protein [Pseudoalteromonas byunsanensis]|uniref:Uncharacterized protein n=1 Tax=Pseudoalteromonas byunsanensis TaxID=327939 RepID=A0A1S1N8B3_9GAMM|nr:hypothetical protein [Pseudoalteromonas byunsanensis]OHU95896.1 hypothetical protein BIW53_08755 [Pseudoalteromonas byunsanensis]
MSNPFDTFKCHAEPLSKALLTAFPNGITPSYETIHAPAHDEPISNQQKSELKEVVHFFVNEGYARKSTVNQTHIVLTQKGLGWLGITEDLLKPIDNPYSTLL